ncbi:hypothetical protein NUW54_g399 [Trametes sanguinea]|uniref:Uncharacterized protein n=1 Tax=Trametes sanguinea TaxID=158606 RepID=A0ACC1QCA5_9APHY|nr:hypothetical protein NUW54_g399 [Trametes sanguinea]
MSAAPGDPVIVQLISSSLLSARMAMGCIALFAYEYLITLDQEIHLIWVRKKTGAALLFLLIRYLALLNVVVINAASFAPLSTKVCGLSHVLSRCPMHLLSHHPGVSKPFLNIPLVLMNLGQVLNVHEGRLRSTVDAVPELCRLLWSTCLGLERVERAPGGTRIPPGMRPFRRQHAVRATGPAVPDALTHVPGVSISRPCVIASDILLVAITWWHAARYGQNWPAHQRVPSLTRVMTINGTLYFLVLTVLNVLHLILTILSFVTVEENTSVATIFTDS